MKITKTQLLDFLIPLSLLVIITVLFRISEWDIQIQSFFYRSETGWFLKDVQPWNWIYKYSNLPALFIAIGSLIIFALSFNFLKFYKYRLISLFLVLVMIIGPGILINSILKGNWGRPRPRNIKEFDGKHHYEEILEIDKTSSGKSFPCGHCSMGFYLMALFFLLRKKKKLLAGFTLIFGILFGSFIGLARIIQGGHFASDTLWSSLLVYLSAAAIYYLMRLDKRLYPLKSFKLTKKIKIINLVIFVILILLILGVILATPYDKHKTFNSKLLPERKYDYIKYSFETYQGDTFIKSGEELKISFSGYGFGFPKSRFKHKFKEVINEDTLFINYHQKKSGYFTELVTNNQININDESAFDIEFITRQAGDIYFSLNDYNDWKIITDNEIINKTKQHNIANTQTINNLNSNKIIRISLKQGKIYIIK